jgi:hypothetical protein
MKTRIHKARPKIGGRLSDERKSIRKTWKIGVPYELADRILILGTLP